jgi:hypothetical protein
VACRGGEPAADPLGILDPADVLEQPQPRRLDHIRCIRLPQPEVPGHGPDQPGVLIDELFPGPFIARSSQPDKHVGWSGTVGGFRHRANGPGERRLRRQRRVSIARCDRPIHSVLLVVGTRRSAHRRSWISFLVTTNSGHLLNTHRPRVRLLTRSSTGSAGRGRRTSSRRTARLGGRFRPTGGQIARSPATSQ